MYMSRYYYSLVVNIKFQIVSYNIIILKKREFILLFMKENYFSICIADVLFNIGERRLI